MKDLLIVSHCILNHAAKVEQDEAELAGEYKIRERVATACFKKRCTVFKCPVQSLSCMGLRDGGM